MSRRLVWTPLAWSNLTHDPKRLAASVAGVGFAVVLIFTELGFLNALLDSTVAPLELLRAKDSRPTLLVVHRDKETLVDSRRFARRWLVSAGAVMGVASANSVYFESAVSDLHNPQSNVSRKIRVMASDSEDLLAMLAESSIAAARLSSPGTALFDIRSKSAFGFDTLMGGLRTASAPEVWLARKPVRLVGTFDVGTDFVNDGNLLVAIRSFDLLFPHRRPFELDEPTTDIGVIRLDTTADAAVVRSVLEQTLGDAGRLRILTLDELIAREQSFWRIHTPIGPIFGLGVVLGFVVGVVICYQVLSSDIRNHMAEYATLKAIGYTNPFLVKVVCQQALWLALLGFVPGALFSRLIYTILRDQTGLPMRMATATVGLVLALTLAMCLSAAYFAIRKLFEADPAELFR
jgi:putative ABC transport system permease protein